jgi:predicted NUDIX family NTP pyrophosphohydrolase
VTHVLTESAVGVRRQNGPVASRRSAGILLFRRAGARVDVLLGHMGGPFWSRRDTGAWSVPKGEYGKVVTVWAAEADLDPGEVVPGTFTMEWPRASGRFQDFPEVDRVEWWGLEQAREKIVVGQRAFLDRLAGRLADLDSADTADTDTEAAPGPA